MSNPLPDLLDPHKAVGQTARFEGRLELRRLPRLAALLLRDDGKSREADEAVRYRLAFRRDVDGRGVVSGQVSAVLPLRCQRCFEAYLLEVEAPISLAVVEGLDEARTLPEHYDPLLVEERLIRPADLIEDELILAVPAIPRHAEGLCQPPSRASAEAADGPAEQGGDAHGKRRPFAVLASLKAGNDDNN
jgi:uncharacterized protein